MTTWRILGLVALVEVGVALGVAVEVRPPEWPLVVVGTLLAAGFCWLMVARLDRNG